MRIWLKASCRTISLAAVAASLFLPLNVSAQLLAQQIVGTWIPVSQYVDQDGKKLEPFGSNPKGMVIYDSNGRFVLVLQRNVTQARVKQSPDRYGRGEYGDRSRKHRLFRQVFH